jgi:hypothetical protein
MFVFAILKSKMESFKSVAAEKKTQQILEGKVPSIVKKEIDKKKEQISHLLNKISDYKKKHFWQNHRT